MAFELGIFGTGSFNFKPDKTPELTISVFTQSVESKDYVKSAIEGKIGAKEFAKNLFADLAYYSKDESDKILESDLNKITENDLDKFCLQFVNNNKHMLIDFANSMSTGKSDSSSTRVNNTIILKHRELDQLESESNFEYLIRFFKTRKELLNQVLAKHFKNFSAISNISSIKPLLKNQIIARNDLSSSISSLQQLMRSTTSPQETLSGLDEKIGALVKVASTTAKVVEGMESLVLSILNEARDSSKKVTRFNYVAITIAVLSLLTTMVFSILTYSSSKGSAEYFRRYSEKELELFGKQVEVDSLLLHEVKVMNKVDTLSK